jgi:ribonuclease P protein component
VGKRVGNAVTRNLVKRRLRSLAQQVRPQLATGFALVITAKAGAAQRSFDDLHAELRGLLRRAKLWQNSDATNPATAQLPAPHHGVITDP